MSSPLCAGVLASTEISATGRRHCETSGFTAAAAPTGDYGLDVHIDAGLLGFSSDGLLSVVQDLVVAPLWMSLVWAVHALVVMLEWSFTVDLLGSEVGGALGGGLRRMEVAFTQPWLALVLSAAAVVAAFNGLVRRRVAETLGHALLMGVMMVGGLWVIADPIGTVGALGAWANQASLGTLAVAARGSPSGPGRAFADGLEGIYVDAIEEPWCYMEFGDVGWCGEPARQDPRLRAASLRIAREELALIGCHSGGIAPTPCTPAGSAQATALQHGAALLRQAQSNGAIFLALPANGPARNSISDPGSLLRALCLSPDIARCSGPAAAQAEFRTAKSTWSRVGGLLLILAGALGMLLLLGFIALRLLAAALFSLLCLLLAPGMVLVPALGESGRALFRRWIVQLLGAVVAKLLFSFLLGVVLAVAAILSALTALGWWTQWLLLSAFWWGAFVRRHQALDLAHGAIGRERREVRPISRRLNDALDPPRKALRARDWLREKLNRPAPERGRGGGGGGDATPSASGRADKPPRGPTRGPGAARGATRHRRPTTSRPTSVRARLERIERGRAEALGAGDRRRALRLADRAARIRASSAREELLRSPGGASPRGRATEAEPGAGASMTRSPRVPQRERDVRAGVEPNAFQRPRARPSVVIEQEARSPRGHADAPLRPRGHLAPAAQGVAGQTDAPGLHYQERPPARVPGRRRAAGSGAGESPEPSSPVPRGARGESPTEDPAAGARESSVMRDAREVAARRKRQLGTDRS